MSTILKALRRIEDEKRAQVETGLREAVATPDPGATATRGRRRNWLLGAVSGALVLSLGWIGYSFVPLAADEEAPGQLAAVSTPAIPEPPDVSRSTVVTEPEDRPPLGTPRPGIQAEAAPPNPVVRPEYRALPLPPEPAEVAAAQEAGKSAPSLESTKQLEPPKQDRVSNPPAPAPVVAKTAPTPRPPPSTKKSLSATPPDVVAAKPAATPAKPKVKPPVVVASAKSATPPATTKRKPVAVPAVTPPATKRPPARKAPAAKTPPRAPAATAPAAKPPPRAKAKAPAAKPPPRAKAKAPAAKPPQSKSVVQRAAPEFAVLSTVWHPVADRRKVVLELKSGDERVELQEGDELGSLRVSEIKPASVVFDQGGKTITRAIGSK